MRFWFTANLQTATSITGPAKSLQKGMPHRVVVASKTLKRAISLYVDCRIYCYCKDSYLFQKSCIPIGGFLSSALLNMYLDSSEDYFMSKKFTRFLEEEFHITGLDFPSLIAPARFEDDLLIISKLLCPDCVDRFVFATYSGRIPIDSRVTSRVLATIPFRKNIWI